MKCYKLFKILPIILLLPSLIYCQKYNANHQGAIDGGIMIVNRGDEKLYFDNYKFDFGYNFNIGDNTTQVILNPSIGFITTNSVRSHRNHFIALGGSLGSLWQLEAGVKIYYLWQDKNAIFSLRTKLYFTDPEYSRLNIGVIGELGNAMEQGYFFMPSLFIHANLFKNKERISKRTKRY